MTTPITAPPPPAGDSFVEHVFRRNLEFAEQIGTSIAAMTCALRALDSDCPVTSEVARQSLRRALAACGRPQP